MRENRETRLLASFISQMEDHRKDFEGFVRDVQNVRYCHTPIDSQQIGRCEYALRNMEVRLLTINNCIQHEICQGDDHIALVNIKMEWIQLKARVDTHLLDIAKIVDATKRALEPVRQSLGAR